MKVLAPVLTALTFAATLILACGQTPAQDAVTIERIGVAPIPGAEIPTYAPTSRRLAIAAGPVVVLIDAADTAPAESGRLDLPRLLDWPGVECSHIAFRPGDGAVAAAAVFARDGDRNRRGEVVLLDTQRESVLARVEVGFGPDSLLWTRDGRRLVVISEAEPRAGEKRLAAVHVVDVPVSAADLEADHARIVSLRVPPLLGALSVEEGRPGWIRTHPRLRTDAVLDIEPESVALSPDDALAYVSLQENNGIMVVDLETASITAAFGLDAIEQTIDPSDQDNGAAVATRIFGLPMPDQLAVFESAGRRFLITANEGDDRGDAFQTEAPLGDRARLAELRTSGRLAGWVEDLLDRRPDLGRLHVLATHGVFAGEGAGRPIDTPLMFGSRSVSVWDAVTLERIWDSGSAFERLMAERAPAYFNAGDDGAVDARSDDRGPEPEGIALATLGAQRLAIVTLERPGALAVIDITEPVRPRIAGFLPTAPVGDTRPEGVAIVRDGDEGDEVVVAVCFEGSGTVATYRIRAAQPRRLSP